MNKYVAMNKMSNKLKPSCKSWSFWKQYKIFLSVMTKSKEMTSKMKPLPPPGAIVVNLVEEVDLTCRMYPFLAAADTI